MFVQIFELTFQGQQGRIYLNYYSYTTGALKTVQCSSVTLTWKNMDSISPMEATCSRLHLTGTLEG